MVEEVEISSFDLRYEGYRIRNPTAEKALLTSILENGIREPLQGVDSPISSSPPSPQPRILLNGFKRYRCAKKLSIGIVPYTSLGSDQASGIITLIRMATDKTLTILEQAKLIDELKKVHQLSVAEMARLLDKSKGWVSMRLGMIEQMSEVVMEKIFKGQFPAYSYMYSLRPFMRMNAMNAMNVTNEIKKKESEEFVQLTSGKSLSTREVDILARGYFSGNAHLREQLKNGDVSWVLNHMKEKETQKSADDCTELERKVLRELESLRYSMGRVTYHGSDSRLKSPSFRAHANPLVSSILKQMESFSRGLEAFYDRIRQT